MNPRLAFDLAYRRHRGPMLAGLVMLIALPILGINVFAPPKPALVAPSDAGNRRAEAHLQAFRTLLIAHETLEARQQAVIDLALREGLVPGHIDFGSEADAAGGFERATLGLPLRGEYADFQRFLAAALAAEPALAVAELALQRDPGGNGILAQLRLVFYVRGAEGEGR